MNFIEANKQIEKHDRILTDTYSKKYVDYLLEKRNNMINEIDEIDQNLKNDNILNQEGELILERYNKLK